MTVYLVHPLHGVHIVYDSQELERHLKLGWKKQGEPVAAEPEVIAPKKRGRPAKVK
jgi:hypothetical protein